MFRDGESVANLDVIFWQTNCEGFNPTGAYLYFKDTATTLVRLSFDDLQKKVEGGEKLISVERLSKDAESFYAKDPSYWILNKQGHVRSFGPLNARLKLGPTVQINSTSTLVPLGLNLLVCWHSLSSNKNHFVLFSKQMEYLSSLSTAVPVSSADLTKPSE